MSDVRRAYIRPGSIVWQDFDACPIENITKDKILFEVCEENSDKDRVWLRAKGYGVSGYYGNGRILARKIDLIYEI